MIVIQLSKKTTTMTNLIATITDNRINLEAAADRINNMRTDGISIYVNDKNVSVSCWFKELSIENQRQEIEWFLDGRSYTIKTF